MSFTFAGLVWAWWITDPLLAVLALIVAIGGRAIYRQRLERYELEQEGGSDESSQAPQDGEPLPDDHYPAAPALSAAGPSEDQGSGQDSGHVAVPEPDLPQPAPDRHHSGPHYLAAVTQGETLQEEIDRLSARLVVLYEQQRQEALDQGKALAAQVAADEAAWDEVLASGAYAHPWWLDQPDALELHHDLLAGAAGVMRAMVGAA